MENRKVSAFALVGAEINPDMLDMFENWLHSGVDFFSGGDFLIAIGPTPEDCLECFKDSDTETVH